jgi:hypothetical protein
MTVVHSSSDIVHIDAGAGFVGKFLTVYEALVWTSEMTVVNGARNRGHLSQRVVMGTESLKYIFTSIALWVSTKVVRLLRPGPSNLGRWDLYKDQHSIGANDIA